MSATQNSRAIKCFDGGTRRVFYPSEHEAINAVRYPGTRQLCSKCEAPTGRCQEDAIWSDAGLPLCEECAAEEQTT